LFRDGFYFFAPADRERVILKEELRNQTIAFADSWGKVVDRFWEEFEKKDLKKNE